MPPTKKPSYVASHWFLSKGNILTASLSALHPSLRIIVLLMGQPYLEIVFPVPKCSLSIGSSRWCFTLPEGFFPPYLVDFYPSDLISVGASSIKFSLTFLTKSLSPFPFST